jgi:hypothetical protein
MDDDRRIFARHLAEATGMRPKDYATFYGAAFAAYDAPVSVERAAHDLGLTTEAFVAMLRAGAKKQPPDLVAANFLRKKPRPIPIRSWHELIPIIQGGVK